MQSNHNANSAMQLLLKNSRRHTLLRYTAFYLAYLLILTLLLGAALLISGDMLMTKSVRIAEEIMQSGIETLEARFDSYDNAAAYFLDSWPIKRIASISIDQIDEYPAYDAHDSFRKAVSFLDADAEYGLLLRNGLLILENVFAPTDEPHITRLLRCAAYTEFDDWYAYITSTPSKRFVPAMAFFDEANKHKTADMMIYKASIATSDDLFFVMIPVDVIEQTIMPASRMLSGALTISVVSGGETHLIYQSPDADQITSSRSITRVSDSGLIVRLDISDDVINAEMQDAQTLFLQIGAAFLLVGLVFAILLAWHNTRPLMILMGAAAQLDTTGSVAVSEKSLNKEYRYFLSVMSNSGAALKAYEKELERHADETRYWAFVSMLTNRDANTPLDLRHPPYGLLLIDGSSATNEVCSMVLSLIRKFLARGSSSTEPLCALIGNTIVVLDCESRFEKRRSEVTQILDTIPEFKYRLVVARTLHNAAEIHAAYAQAIYMLSLSLPEESASSEVSIVPHPVPHDAGLNKLTQFSYASVYHLLTSGQIDALTEMLDGCITFFHSGGYAGESLVRYVYDACAASLSTVKAKYPEITADIVIPDYSANLHLETQFTRLRELMVQVHTALRAFYERDTVTKTKQIMQFIDENLTNCELYIKMVTSQFSISENELQSHVRSASGMSFFSYVERGRMAQARKLVCESNLTFTQISMECGYSSNISFTRAFARFYGVSPSKMRSSLAKEAERQA